MQRSEGSPFRPPLLGEYIRQLRDKGFEGVWEVSGISRVGREMSLRTCMRTWSSPEGLKPGDRGSWCLCTVWLVVRTIGIIEGFLLPEANGIPGVIRGLLEASLRRFLAPPDTFSRRRLLSSMSCIYMAV
jgi:hypothetical protein